MIVHWSFLSLLGHCKSPSRMRIGILIYVGIVGVFAVGQGRVLRADEPAVAGADSDPVAAELGKLGDEYHRVSREWLAALPVGGDGHEESDSKLPDEEWLRQGLELERGSPDSLLPRFLALAKEHPDSPAGLDALAFVIRRGGYHTGDVLGEPWQLKEQAIDLVSRHHMADPAVVHVFTLLSGSLPSQKTEAFLRQVIERSPNRVTRAAAIFSLAEYLRNSNKAQARSGRIKARSRVANNERFWKLVVTPYLEKLPYDEAQVSAEIERLLAQVVDDYGDVEATKWKWSGPAKVFVGPEPYPKPKTYGDLAKSLLFELNHLVPGKQAPEIEGMDAAGVRFRLSDYRGKVVLLTFSADWCGGCVQLYPLERGLVDKFRDEPFALLSVSCDEKLETLQASTAAGDITWRCWWDGLNGPIHSAWNSPGAPKIYLLDQQGVIQDVNLNRATPAKEFEHAIAALLSKASAKDSSVR